MRILILTEEPYPYNLGGGTSYLKDFETGLKHYSIDYDIIATKFYLSNPKKEGATNLGIPLIKSNNFLIRSAYKLIYYPSWFISTIFYLLKNKRYKEFNAIHAHEPLFSGTLAIILKLLFKKPIYITMHGKFAQGLKDRMKINNILLNLINKYEKFIVNKFDKVFCISREIKDYYSKYNSNSIFIPNFIDLDKYKYNNKKEVKTIAYIGRLSKEKNVELLLKIAPSFPQKSFLIIGDGPEMENLKDLTKKLKAKNISFLGRRKDIAKLHSKIDLLVYLWKNEPFGLSALEGMASGIPIISADTNELHYFVGKSKAGVVINKDKIDEKSLSEAIRNAEKNVKSLSENARKEALKYDYKFLVKNYIKQMSLGS